MAILDGISKGVIRPSKPLLGPFRKPKDTYCWRVAGFTVGARQGYGTKYLFDAATQMRSGIARESDLEGSRF